MRESYGSDHYANILETLPTSMLVQSFGSTGAYTNHQPTTSSWSTIPEVPIVVLLSACAIDQTKLTTWLEFEIAYVLNFFV